MQDLGHLRELEEEIRKGLLTGEQLQDMEICEEYIYLVQQIEGKPISEFSMADEKKYKYLSLLSEHKINKFWKRSDS